MERNEVILLKFTCMLFSTKLSLFYLQWQKTICILKIIFQRCQDPLSETFWQFELFEKSLFSTCLFLAHAHYLESLEWCIWRMNHSSWLWVKRKWEEEIQEWFIVLDLELKKWKNENRGIRNDFLSSWKPFVCLATVGVGTARVANSWYFQWGPKVILTCWTQKLNIF